MEYIEYYNKVVDVIEGDGKGMKLTDQQLYDLRVITHKAYKHGFREGKKEIVDTKSIYEEGRLVGHSLGYKEGLEAGKVIRKQRLLNSFGGR